LNDETKQLLDEVKAGVVAELKSDPELLRKDVFGSDEVKSEDKLIESKQKAADFVKAVYVGDLAKVKALSEGVNADGGYMVPEYFSNEVLRLAPIFGVARRNARVLQVLGLKTHFPTADAVTAYRVGEKVAIPSSQPTIGRVTLVVKKIAAMIPMTNELLDDANVNTIDLIIRLVAEAFAKYEDEWAFLGKAEGEGVFQDPLVSVLNLASGKNTFAEVDFDDLLLAMDKLDESALSGAKWYMSFSVFNALRALKYASGTASYILQEPSNGQPATIWNLPVEFSKVLPKTTDQTQASTKFIALGNLDHMIIGDRMSMEIKISDVATVTDTDGSTGLNLFEQDMSALRAITRKDIQLTNQAKAFVAIKTAAS
jgi:HK97 family phage major capsid protein